MKKDAILSKCQRYRYVLERTWDTEPHPRRCVWILLNPSTADAEIDDPTVRRCISFSKYWGYEGMFMVNLFAFRATNPKELKKAEDPVGPENSYHLLHILNHAEHIGSQIIIAWGNHGSLNGRNEEFLTWLRKYRSFKVVYHLGLTKSKQPKHPLYLAKDTELIEMEL